MLEHINITVSDPKRTTEMLCRLFDWNVRWSGHSSMGGETVHVGQEDSYLAVYSEDGIQANNESTYAVAGSLNHVGVVVPDLDQVEQRVIEAGFKPHMHGDYEPGRRFYFNDHDNIEYEVVSYN